MLSAIAPHADVHTQAGLAKTQNCAEGPHMAVGVDTTDELLPDASNPGDGEQGSGVENVATEGGGETII